MHTFTCDTYKVLNLSTIHIVLLIIIMYNICTTVRTLYNGTCSYVSVILSKIRQHTKIEQATRRTEIKNIYTLYKIKTHGLQRGLA